MQTLGMARCRGKMQTVNLERWPQGRIQLEEEGASRPLAGTAAAWNRCCSLERACSAPQLSEKQSAQPEAARQKLEMVAVAESGWRRRKPEKVGSTEPRWQRIDRVAAASQQQQVHKLGWEQCAVGEWPVNSAEGYPADSWMASLSRGH
eukprot:2315639-Rhodomonas_salina.1